MKLLPSILLLFYCFIYPDLYSQELTLRSNTGHAVSGISNACFSPNEKYVASLGYDGVKLWDIESGKELRTWKGGLFSKDLLFTPDSRKIIVSTQSNAYILIDIETGIQEIVKQNAKYFTYNAMVISPDGKFLGFLGDDLITVWDLISRTQKIQRKIGHSVGGMLFSEDSKSLFFGQFNGYYSTLKIDDNIIIPSDLKQGKDLNAIRFSLNNSLALVNNNDYSIDLLDLNQGKIKKTIFKSDFAWTAFDLSYDGRYALIGGTLDNSARIISLENFDEVILPRMPQEIKVVRFSSSGKFVLTNSVADGSIMIWNTRSGELVQTLKGSFESSTLRYSSKESLVLQSKSLVRVWDLKTNAIKMYPLDSTILCTYIKDDSKIYAVKRESILANRYKLVNLISDEILISFELDERYKFTKKSECIISEDESLMILTESDGTFHPFQWINIKNGVVHKPLSSKYIGPKLISRFRFLRNSKGVVMYGSRKSKEKSIIFDYEQNKISEFKTSNSVFFQNYAVSSTDQMYYTTHNGIFQVDLLTGKRNKIRSKEFIPREEISNLILFNTSIAIDKANQKLCYGYQNITFKGLSSNKLETIPSASLSLIYYLNFIANDSILVSGSIDGQIKFWDVHSKKEILELRNPSSDEWVVKSPDGLFDASPNEFHELYFVKDLDIIELNQIKSRFYEPFLLQKKLGFSREILRKSKGLGKLDLYPSIKLEDINNDQATLRIKLTEQGGGIGKVVVKINGKEAIDDARKFLKVLSDSSVVIDFPFSNHPFLLQNTLNSIDVIAFNKEEYLQSRPKRFNFVIDSEGGRDSDINFYGLFVGVSDYSGDAIDLRYASKDAESLSQSIKWSAENQFGLINTHITSLTSGKDQTLQPSKETIKNYFTSLSSKAKPQDILMIYLAGHGLNYGGEEGDFYFLTAEASSADIKDPAIRKSVSISSQELTEFIKMVPSLKQVMVIDACHAGQYTYDLLASARSEKPASEIRALERIKDRTGLYVLSGSAADAVSYEASIYGQGLLTYALLFGIKGAALRDGKYIDVMNLFQFAADEVPRLAETVGGIQKPEIRVPYGAKSFDVGLVDESIQSKIILPSPKPLFSKSNYSDEETFNDDLRISERIDELLIGLKGRDTDVVFVNVNRFPNAYSLKGRYVKGINGYQVQSKLFKNDLLLNSFETLAQDVEMILIKISETVTRYINENP